MEEGRGQVVVQPPDCDTSRGGHDPSCRYRNGVHEWAGHGLTERFGIRGIMLGDLDIGSTNWGAINLTVCPSFSNSRAQWCVLRQSSMPTRQVGKFANGSFCPCSNFKAKPMPPLFLNRSYDRPYRRHVLRHVPGYHPPAHIPPQSHRVVNLTPK